MEARRFQRVSCRLPLEVCCGGADLHHSGRSRDISAGGLFAAGLGGLVPGSTAQVTLGPTASDRLHLTSRVSRTDSSGVALEFVDNSPASLEVLHALLDPVWDGGSLLEGIVRIAPWHEDDSLVNWMRLTSLVSDWQRLRYHP